MYSNVKSYVAIRGFNSEYLKSSMGLMRGKSILFSLYVNDFEKYFLTAYHIKLGPLNLFLLLYEDIIFFSDSIYGLQRELFVLQ